MNLKLKFHSQLNVQVVKRWVTVAEIYSAVPRYQAARSPSAWRNCPLVLRLS
jgi:hypothetical protein